ncbi:MAG: sigma-70 family RNA polymerase sigma factor [Nocardioides sp.]
MIVVPVGPAPEGAQLLRALHDEHGAALWRYALRLTDGDNARAQDVVQETFIRAWRNPRAFDPERGSARPWLYAVARRIIIDDSRSARARHEAVREELPDAGVPDGTEAVDDRDVVRQALARLSPEHRAVLRECYYRQRSVEEASAILGIAPGTVKSRTHYAIRALRIALEELGGMA